MSSNGNGKKWWWTGLGLTVAGILVGVAGNAYVARDAIARHERAIEALTVRATETEVDRAKLATQLASIDGRLANIEGLLRARP